MLSLTWVTVVGPQLSLDVTLPVLTGGTWLAHCTVTLLGHVIDGGVLSTAVISCMQVAVLPQASVAVYVLTTVKLFGHVCPVVASEEVTVTAPAQLSEVVTLPGAGGGTPVEHCTVTLGGQVMVGGVLSKTCIV
jgi:hypothetical protein